MVASGGAGLRCFRLVSLVGTITEFDTKTLVTAALPDTTTTPRLSTTLRCAPFLRSRFHQTLMSRPPAARIGSVNNATIGGCLTFLLGPVALAFD